jgi:hypothetical protein
MDDFSGHFVVVVGNWPMDAIVTTCRTDDSVAEAEADPAAQLAAASAA